MSARVRRVRPGEWLGGAAGAVLFATPWLAWYGGDSGLRCVRGPCPSIGSRTGWETLGGFELALLAGGVIGLLVLIAALVLGDGPTLAAVHSFAVLAGLGCAALATYLWGRGPVDAGPERALASLPLLGAWLAPIAAFGIAAGAWWSLRVRPFVGGGPSSKGAADVGRVCLVCGALALIGSLFLPWFDDASIGGPLGRSGGFTILPLDAPPGEVTGFEAFIVSDALLVILALFAVASALVALRSDLLGLDVAALLAAGMALTGPVVSISSPGAILLGGGAEFTLHYGAAIGLAAAVLAVLGGTWASLWRGPRRPPG